MDSKDKSKLPLVIGFLILAVLGMIGVVIIMYYNGMFTASDEFEIASSSGSKKYDRYDLGDPGKVKEAEDDFLQEIQKARSFSEVLLVEGPNGEKIVVEDGKFNDDDLSSVSNKVTYSEANKFLKQTFLNEEGDAIWTRRQYLVPGTTTSEKYWGDWEKVMLVDFAKCDGVNQDPICDPDVNVKAFSEVLVNKSVDYLYDPYGTKENESVGFPYYHLKQTILIDGYSDNKTDTTQDYNWWREEMINIINEQLEWPMYYASTKDNKQPFQLISNGDRNWTDHWGSIGELGIEVNSENIENVKSFSEVLVDKGIIDKKNKYLHLKQTALIDGAVYGNDMPDVNWWREEYDISGEWGIYGEAPVGSNGTVGYEMINEDSTDGYAWTDAWGRIDELYLEDNNGNEIESLKSFSEVLLDGQEICGSTFNPLKQTGLYENETEDSNLLITRTADCEQEKLIENWEIYDMADWVILNIKENQDDENVIVDHFRYENGEDDKNSPLDNKWYISNNAIYHQSINGFEFENEESSNIKYNSGHIELDLEYMENNDSYRFVYNGEQDLGDHYRVTLRAAQLSPSPYMKYGILFKHKKSGNQYTGYLVTIDNTASSDVYGKGNEIALYYRDELRGVFYLPKKIGDQDVPYKYDFNQSVNIEEPNWNTLTVEFKEYTEDSANLKPGEIEDLMDIKVYLNNELIIDESRFNNPRMQSEREKPEVGIIVMQNEEPVKDNEVPVPDWNLGISEFYAEPL